MLYLNMFFVIMEIDNSVAHSKKGGRNYVQRVEVIEVAR